MTAAARAVCARGNVEAVEARAVCARGNVEAVEARARHELLRAMQQGGAPQYLAQN